jgi:hypothetical protein
MTGHREKLEDLAATFLGMSPESREAFLVALSKHDGACSDTWFKILLQKHKSMLENQNDEP